MKSVLSIMLILQVLLHAQNTNYLPHAVGDMWEYAFIDGISHIPLDTFQVMVVKDSIDPQGNTHVYKVGRPITPPQPWPPVAHKEYTIDTLNQVWGRYSGGINLDSALIYKLGALKGDKWVIWQYEEDQDCEMARINDIRLENILGVSKKLMEINYYYAFDSSDTNGLARYGDILVEDFGLFQRSGAPEYDTELLIGAVINGVAYGDTTQILTISRSNNNIPESIILHQNYPNPFNSSTKIEFSLNKADNVSLVIYDVTGREVVELIKDQNFSPGNYSVQWNGKNRKGGDVNTGMYMCVLNSQNFNMVKKLLIMR